MRLCAALTNAGEPCERLAQRAELYCLGHDPDRSAERRRIAKRGGRGHMNTEMHDAKDYLKHLRDDVRTGACTPSVGAVVNQIVNTLLRAIEVERKIKEQEEILPRLEALEEEKRLERSYGQY
jgi:hypothetical protein